MSLIDFSKIDEMQSDVSYITKRIETYKAKMDILQSNIKMLKDDIDVLDKRKVLINNAKEYYFKVVDKCYAYSIEEMENFVNYVLAYVFYDESYKIKLDITNKRNKSITFYFIDENKGLENPLRKGNGKGVKAVASFILYTYYLLRMKSPYVFLDESFVNISASYVERFFSYVKKLCNDYGLCVVLITHDMRFPEYTDKIYQIVKGKVICVHDNKKQ